MTVTIKDIAKDTGLALSTISVVLNNKTPNIPISEKTKEKILQSAKNLGYYPNFWASSLRSRKTHSIGVVFANTLEEINNLNSAQALSGVGSIMDKTNYNLYMFTGYKNIKERYLNAAKGKLVDGLIYFVYSPVFNDFHQEISVELKKYKIPYIGVQYYEHHIDTNCVCIRAGRAGEIAVRHLSGLGRKSIGLIDYFARDSFARAEIVESFSRMVKDYGTSQHRIYYREDYQDSVDSYREDWVYPAGYNLAQSIIERSQLLDSYFITSDVIASGFVDGLAERGVKVPDDVAVVGYGNQLNPERGSNFLTTVDCHYSRIGEMAAEQMIGMLEQNAPLVLEKTVTLEPELIIRKSCGGKVKT
jgi:LacI family transcriptional regulator